MAKSGLIISIIVSFFALAGCNGVDTGKAQILPPQSGMVAGPSVDITKSGEADLAEQLSKSRQAYRR